MPNPVALNKPNYTTELKFVEMMIDAYHRCGVYLPLITGQHIKDAIRSANLILIDYNNRGSNLYSIQTEIIPLEQGVPCYSVPDFYEINDVTLANFIRQTTYSPGVASSTAGGNAALAFDGDPATSCEQTSEDGDILFTFSEATFVQFVGFQTAQADGQTYNLQFFYKTIASNDSTEKVVYETGPITPFPNQPYYFFLNPGQQAVIWGVREIGGAEMNMAEVFFMAYNQSRTISALSRQDWMTLSDKNLNTFAALTNTANQLGLVRQLTTPTNPGVPNTSSGGTAAFAFDGNPNTSCDQNADNGNITYTFTQSAELVQVVGFQASTANPISLQFYYQDVGTGNITVVHSTGLITPVISQVYYYYLNANDYASSLKWGVRAIGNTRLRMEEVYFWKYAGVNPWPPQPNSSLYQSPGTVVPTSAGGFPSGYYVDRQPSPVINLYPMPDLSYPYCVFTYTSYFQAIKALQDVLHIPGSFIPAIVGELAMSLATKYAPDRLEYLTAQAEKLFLSATNEDRQKVTFKITYDYSQFMSN